MKIALINENSQAAKNAQIYEMVYWHAFCYRAVPLILS